MTIRLFNGAATPEAWNPKSPHFVDGWKPEERLIECDGLSVTYGGGPRLFKDGDIMLWLEYDTNGLLMHDGLYFGDWEVITEE
jgi:hypothetical protein